LVPLRRWHQHNNINFARSPPPKTTHTILTPGRNQTKCFQGGKGAGAPQFWSTINFNWQGNHDLADVMFHVNGVLRDTDYRVSVATDRKSISWQRAIQTICFSKKILEAILKNA
jgi:hypothetical protein